MPSADGSQLFTKPHRRFNPLTGEYVLVSPHRTQRPWLGEVASNNIVALPTYDPGCYLCPGNARTGGAHNPNYDATFTFPNDYPALLTDRSDSTFGSGLLNASPVAGECRVICYSPRHDLTLATMSGTEVEAVVDAWCTQTADLGAHYAWVQIFQNQGAMMGASNPHPHGQVWAQDALPEIASKEDLSQREYANQHARPLLVDYLAQEREDKQRVILETQHWLAVVPFWALWPYETLLMPKRHVLRLPDLDQSERRDLSMVMNQLMVRYDNLFQSPFPYSLGWHSAPFTPGDNSHWQLHAHIFPPLLRSAQIKKFMVGYEMLAEPQRDLSAEQAAARLLDLPSVHYSQRLA